SSKGIMGYADSHWQWVQTGMVHSPLLVFDSKKHCGMLAVVHRQDHPVKVEIDAQPLGLPVGRDFHREGDNSPRFVPRDLEYLQVVLFDSGGHRVDEGPEGPVKGRMELVGNAAGDVAWVLEHTITSLG